MRHLPAPVLAACAASLLVLAGCGDGDPEPTRPPGPPGTFGTSASATSSSTPSPSAPDLARVTLLRTGGVAGFADVLLVQGDGAVIGTTRGGPVDCRVAAGLARTLATGPAVSAPPAAGADRVAVQLLREDGPVPLGEAQGGDPVSVAARTLLDDVQQAEGSRTVCR